MLFPPPKDLPNPGIEPQSPRLQGDSSLSEPLGNPIYLIRGYPKYLRCQYNSIPIIKKLYFFKQTRDMDTHFKKKKKSILVFWLCFCYKSIAKIQAKCPLRCSGKNQTTGRYWNVLHKRQWTQAPMLTGDIGDFSYSLKLNWLFHIFLFR